ncbi:S8 family peptidase [Clostridium sp. LP20]|uniref:S8 family peptidase n=1 Tax=Clostridium sp. LP20 TaxID=3418665 RepID=UPI003EE499AB
MSRSLGNCYYNEDYINLVVGYRGNFKEEIDKVDYACGATINDKLAVISIEESDIGRLKIDIPSILVIQHKSIFILQNTAPTNVSNIDRIQENQYLGLDGSNVLVGIVDTGIDYLNKEFIREDDTSRILSIWDQTVILKEKGEQYIGQVFSNEEINKAIIANRNNEDPYGIVPSKDEIGHGTKVASIIGARGYDDSVKGIAPNCEFVIVKLQESRYYNKLLNENGIKPVPVYNASEILSGVEYLKNYAVNLSKPMVIYIGLGTTEGSHDGKSLMSKYLSLVAEIEGIVVVAGTGNEGNLEGHKLGKLNGVGSIENIELKISKPMKSFYFYIWVGEPDRVTLNIISPNGTESSFIAAKVDRVTSFKFALMDTSVYVRYFVPDNFTGKQMIEVSFNNIKDGIWNFQLKGEYITVGRYDIWLPPGITIPDGTKFLEPDPYTTLVIPSMGKNVISVAHYNQENNSILPASGKGFTSDEVTKPGIAAAGINILTTDISGSRSTLSGSSAATAIVAGACAIVLQWGIIKGNDRSMTSKKVESYLVYGADRKREDIQIYPNRNIGYGILNLFNSLNIVIGNYRVVKEDNYYEYYINNLFIRIPENLKYIREERI